MMEHIIPLEELIKMTWFSVRAKRDKMISDTDWTQMSDSPLSVDKIEEFKVYRQVLRDLPQSTDNPDEIVWPVKP